MMWVLVALIVTEGLVIHLLLALWQPWLAIALSLLSVGTLVWLVVAIRSFRRLPVEITTDSLLWRVGTLRTTTVPLDNIAGFKSEWTSADIKRRDVLNCAMIAFPNTVIALRAPVVIGRRLISTLAHRLDDPVGFAAALDAVIAAR